jgi:hypothetical protein
VGVLLLLLLLLPQQLTAGAVTHSPREELRDLEREVVVRRRRRRRRRRAGELRAGWCPQFFSSKAAHLCIVKIHFPSSLAGSK